MNLWVAELGGRHRAMPDFTWKPTESPREIAEADRQSQRDAGFTEAESSTLAT